jgi:RNA polymerase primary sigma factor
MSSYLEEKSSEDLYFNEISKYDLISSDREKELAKKIQKGGKNGTKALQELVNANLRLVVKIAGEFKGFGLDSGDLINEGNLGLMKAAEKYDGREGVKFSTYSAYWIRQSIYRALSNKSRTIRLPVHVCAANSKIVKFISDYQERNGGERPSIKEISKATDATERLVSDVVNGGVTNLNSLDREVGTDDGGSKETLGSIVEDEGSLPPDQIWKSEEDVNILLKLIQKLNNRERYIICNRFGIGTKSPKTLEQIGEHFGVTRERIRQVQKVAMMKLKNYMDKYYRYKPEVEDHYTEGRRFVAKVKREEKAREKKKNTKK